MNELRPECQEFFHYYYLGDQPKLRELREQFPREFQEWFDNLSIPEEQE